MRNELPVNIYNAHQGRGHMVHHAVDGYPVTSNKLNFPPVDCGVIERV